MIKALYLHAVFALMLATIARGAPPKVTRFTLENGLRIVVMEYEGSPHCAMFSFLPLGLAADGPDRTQWSHLVEHLTLRTTGSITDYRERNAETMGLGMHLDWMGSVGRWKEGLDLQAKWLAGLPFEEAILREEVPKALSEIDGTVPRGFTHKWALVAWNQAMRHGRDRVSVRGALETAPLADVAKYRDDHLVLFDRAMLCVVGGVSAETLRPVLSQRLGSLRSKAKALPAASAGASRPGDRHAKWDVAAGHLLVSWPIPAAGTADYAALHVTAQALGAQLVSDPAFQSSPAPILVSTDTVSPEGTFFVVSAPLAGKADPAKVRERTNHHLASLRDSAAPNIPMMAQGLLAQLAPENLDPTRIRQQGVPGHVTDAMLEANIGLQRGLLEWRLPNLATFADELKNLTNRQAAEAIRKHLADDKRSTLLIEPDGK